MLFITIIIVAIALAFLLAKLQAKLSKGTVVTPAPVSAVPPGAQKVRNALVIDGTEPFKGHIGFVKSFGITPGEVSDVRFFTGAGAAVKSLPERVRDCLDLAYARGFSRGTEVPAMLQGTRDLDKDEALYFALVQNPRVPPFIVAFVDKLRSA